MEKPDILKWLDNFEKGKNKTRVDETPQKKSLKQS